MVIPISMRAEILEKIHSGHQGMTEGKRLCMVARDQKRYR